MAYVPPQSPMTRDDWPTLKEMLDSGKRLVVFMDKAADEKTVPFILPQFPMVCARASLSLLPHVQIPELLLNLDVGRRIRSR